MPYNNYGNVFHTYGDYKQNPSKFLGSNNSFNNNYFRNVIEGYCVYLRFDIRCNWV